MSKQLSPIESLERQLRHRFESARIALDRPKQPSGTWYLDIKFNQHPVVVQWREGSAFGVSSSTSHSYGDGADEVYPNEEATYGRVVSLLLSRTFTSPPELLRLRELRKERGLSQAELALLLNRQQGEVSKIERRSDVLVSTLREVVQSMGAKLSIIARFPDGAERALEIGETSSAEKSRQSVSART